MSTELGALGQESEVMPLAHRRSPSVEAIRASLCSHTAAQHAPLTVSKTGCTSVGGAGDNTKDFARRCLLLQRFFAFSSLNNRTFSIAITAWSAKVSSSLICAGENRHPLGATNHESPDQLPLLAQRPSQ